MLDLDQPSEPMIHSFIVKIFVESASDDTPAWHGYVTHVPGGERRYLTSLKQISPFVASYLGSVVTEQMRLRRILTEMRRRIPPRGR